MQMRLTHQPDADERGRAVLVATMQKLRKQAGAAAKRGQYAKVARLAEQYKAIEQALLGE